MERKFDERSVVMRPSAATEQANRAALQAARRPAGTVEWLQRSLGNAAVQRMLGGVVIQRQIQHTFAQWLGDEEPSLESLRLYLETVISPVYLQVPKPSGGLAKAYSDIMQTIYADDADVAAQRKRIDDLVGDVNREHPSTKAITTPTSKAVVEEKKSASREKKSVVPEKKSAATASKRRGVTEEKEQLPQTGAEAVKRQLTDHFNKVWNHLAIGGNKEGRPVGYHTLCEAAQAVCKIPEKYKARPIKSGEFGVYQHWVIVKPKGSSKEAEPKDKDFSTFWPDDWTKQDIMDVCVSLSQYRKGHDLVVELEQTTSGKACAGLTVRLTDESFYPVIK
jgi:hypothetical protein